MPYSDKDFKDSNVNYLNKDFSALKSTLMEYAKTYFPNTYRDFNETSPGMMLIEMSAYVGDVLSFYIDQQYREMMLPLAEERRNIVNIAKMLGYKVKPTTPAKAELRVTMTVGADTTDINNPVPLYSEALLYKKGMKVQATSNTNIFFETIEDVDFTVSGAYDGPPTSSAQDASSEMVTQYTLTRHVLGISGETKTKIFLIESPEKFLELTLPDTNVISIESVIDANSNKWYEVEYLAQDKVPLETAFYNDLNDARTGSAYYDTVTGAPVDVPIPYSLSYLLTSKRFTVEIDENNYTSLVFGNGLLRTGAATDLQGVYNATQNSGLILPGSISDIQTAIGTNNGSVYSTLGETPANTTLTVTYRVGGGMQSNIPVGDLATVVAKEVVGSDTSQENTVSTINADPARGGSSGETIEEIRHRARAFFTTQNRCVTKEDYEARVMNLPARFGNIAKVHVKRADINTLFSSASIADQTGSPDDTAINLTEFANLYDGSIPTIEIYTLSYDKNKNLVNTPSLIQQNLKTYLGQYRMITDTVTIKNGYVINFGVVFDVVAHKYANKSEVKLKCIDAIRKYFNVATMQFKQPLYISQLEYELMNVDGVRAVNYTTLTQDTDYNNEFTNTFAAPLWNCTLADGCGAGTSGYGYVYQFGSTDMLTGALSSDGSIVMPSIDPAIFELKRPNDNIIGVVR